MLRPKPGDVNDARTDAKVAGIGVRTDAKVVKIGVIPDVVPLGRAVASPTP